MRPHTITYPPDGVEPIGVIEFVHGMCETSIDCIIFSLSIQWSISADADIYVPLPICVDTEKTY